MSDNEPARTQWEYTSENLTLYDNTWPARMSLLTQLGCEGWEVISIFLDDYGEYRAILKRQVVNNDQRSPK